MRRQCDAGQADVARKDSPYLFVFGTFSPSLVRSLRDDYQDNVMTERAFPALHDGRCGA